MGYPRISGGSTSFSNPNSSSSVSKTRSGANARSSTSHVTKAKRPPGRSTRRTSRNALARLGTSWRTNDDIAASNDASGNGISAANATWPSNRSAAPGWRSSTRTSTAPIISRDGSTPAIRTVGQRASAGDRQVAGTDSDIDEVDRPGTDLLVEPVEQSEGARCEHRRPPTLIAGRDPVVSLGLVGHGAIVPCRPPLL